MEAKKQSGESHMLPEPCVQSRGKPGIRLVNAPYRDDPVRPLHDKYSRRELSMRMFISEQSRRLGVYIRG